MGAILFPLVCFASLLRRLENAKSDDLIFPKSVAMRGRSGRNVGNELARIPVPSSMMEVSPSPVTFSRHVS